MSIRLFLKIILITMATVLCGMTTIPMALADRAVVPSPLLSSIDNSSLPDNKPTDPANAVDTTSPLDKDDQLPASTPVQSEEASVALAGDEHLLWDKRPLDIVLPVGKERLVSFSESVELINTNPDLTGEKLGVMINAGTIYLTAHARFEPIRISIRLKNSGRLILLNLSAAEKADDTPIDVLVADKKAISSDRVSNFKTTDIDLLRFAITQLFSPARLMTQPDGVTRTAMYTQKNVTIFYDNTTLAFPIASWRDNEHFVTAITIKNTQQKTITLDPRHLHGNWLAATFYPTNQLKPQGLAGDSTTLFLISSNPFGESLNVLQGEIA